MRCERSPRKRSSREPRLLWSIKRKGSFCISDGFSGPLPAPQRSTLDIMDPGKQFQQSRDNREVEFEWMLLAETRSVCKRRCLVERQRVFTPRRECLSKLFQAES